MSTIEQPNHEPQGARLPPVSLRVQVVLFQNGREQVLRLVEAVAASGRVAKAQGVADEVRLALGDCSPEPVFPDTSVIFTEPAVEPDLDGVSCRNFGANLGFGHAHNELFAEGDHQFVVFLNPDTYPSPRLLVGLVEALRGSRVALADARQIPFEHPKYFDPITGDTGWASGACLGASSEIFDRIGRFDSENFFLYCEDVDLSWRSRLAGYRVVHAVDAVVFHDKRPDASTGAVTPTPFELFHSLLSRLILAHKYGRRDIVRQTVDWVLQHGHDDQKRAVRVFQERERGGALPHPLPRAREVAEFVKGEYAQHRF